MGTELTAAEQKFFETGELPEELAPAPAPEPAPAPAPAPAAEEGTPAPAPAPDPTEVLRQQLEADTAARARLEARINEINERLASQQQQQQRQPDPGPNPQEDPLGAILHELKTTKEQLAQMQQQTQLTEQQANSQRQFTEFAANIQRQRDEFIKTTPDFTQAYEHLRKMRSEDLRDAGVPLERIPQVMLQDEIAVSLNAQQQNKNPAQVIYNMAKRYGYKPSAAPVPAPNPADKITQLQNGQAAATAPARGGSESALTFEGLKDAGDADLNKLVQSDDMWHKLVGNSSNSIF